MRIGFGAKTAIKQPDPIIHGQLHARRAFVPDAGK